VFRHGKDFRKKGLKPKWTVLVSEGWFKEMKKGEVLSSVHKLVKASLKALPTSSPPVTLIPRTGLPIPVSVVQGFGGVKSRHQAVGRWRK